MIIPNQKIIVRWVPSNKKYYTNKGYKFTQWGDEFEVDIADISHGNHTKVECICDVCGKYFYRSIKSIYTGNPDYFCCGDFKCALEIRKNTNLERYGVENTYQSEEKKEKIKQTMLKRYGAENPNQSEIIKEKIKQTNLERYGFENPYQVEQFKEKSKQTNLKRYGFEFASQNEEIKEKQKQVMLEKYGETSPAKIDFFRQKMAETRYKRNICCTSKAQKHISNILNGILNYPICGYNVDIMLDNHIYIEYDGFAHYIRVYQAKLSEEEFQAAQNKRDNDIAKLNWKLIRIIDKKNTWNLYNDKFYKNIVKISKQLFNKSLDLKFIIINLDNRTIEYNDFIQTFEEVHLSEL